MNLYSYFVSCNYSNTYNVWMIVGDSGYPQRPWLMTPILDAADGTPANKYNTIHGKTRVTIENAFGRLKNRWRCLCKDRTLHYAPQKCAKIIRDCCVLHNLAINFNVPEPEEQISNIIPQPVTQIFRENMRDELMMGRAIRNLLVEKINRLHR